MIVVKLISGLGNQLFQYAIGRQLSIKHGVPLKLDTTFFETQSLRNYSLDKYNIQAELMSGKEVNNIKYWWENTGFIPRVYRRLQRLLPRSRRRYFKEQQWWQYDPDLLNVSANVYLDGYWQHHKYFLDISPKIFNELTLKEPATGVQALDKEIVSEHSSVSVHIRRGDYLKDTLMNVLPMEYYTAAFELIQSKIDDPCFYIFSDDLNWVKDNLRTSFVIKYIDLGSPSNSDFIELDLMRKCRHNIIANSSFSWWGAFLKSNPDKIVISPKEWVVNPEINARIQLQFPSWIKM